MALDSGYKNKILRALPSDYRLAYQQGALDDDYLERFAEQAGITADDFSDVSTSVDSTSPFAAPTTTDTNDTSLIDRAQGSIQRMIGSGIATAADSDNPFVSTLTKVPGLVRAITDPTGRAVRELSTTNTGIADAGNLLSAADENKRIADEAQASRNAARGEGIIATPTRWLDETVGDIVDSPSSLASLAGGPFAALGGADVYAQTYARARAAGMTKDQATEQAGAQAGIEVGMSVIPAGKLLERLPFGAAVKRKLANEFGTIASRTATGALRTGAGEAVEEGVTQVLQTEANRALAAIAEDPREKDYLTKQLPATSVEYFNEVVRATRAGGVAGTAIGAPASRFEAIADAARNASDTINAVSNNTQAIPNRPEFGPLEPTPIERRSIEEQAILNASRDFLGAPLQQNDGVRQEMASATRPDRDALLREAERTAAGIVADAGPQDAQDFISTPFGAVSRANTIPTSPTNGVDADSIADYNEQLAAATASRIAALKSASATVGKQESGKKRSAASALTAAKRAYMLEEQKKLEGLPPAERIQRLADAEQAWAASEAANVTEETIPNAGVQMPAANLPFEQETPNAPQAAPTAPQATPTPTATTPRAATPAAQERAAVRAAEAEEKREAGIVQLMAADPTLSRQEAEEAFAPATTLETEADIRAAYPGNRLSSVAPTPPAQGMDANSFITAIAERVRKGDSKQANVVAKLIRDGKLVVTNTAEEIEAGATPGTQGQFDPATGTLYINASAMDASNPIGSVLQQVASHEVDHAARVSGNTDLRNAASGILGEENFKKLVERLKAGTDPISKAAVAGADKANAARKAAGQPALSASDYDLEVAAYGMQEAARQYADAKGVPALWRGAVSAIRTTAQKYIPGLDVNLKDMGYLGQKMLEAAATTEQSLAGSGSRLNMIYPSTATDFSAAKDAGLVYRSSNGLDQFVLSDADSSILPSGAARLARMKQGDSIQLNEVMKHDTLFRNMPESEDITITRTSEEDGDSWGMYLPGTGVVKISTPVRQGTASVTLRETLLHEIQHWVQEQSDAKKDYFSETFEQRPQQEQDAITAYQEALASNDAAARVLLDSAPTLTRAITDVEGKRAALNLAKDPNLSDGDRARELAELTLDYAPNTDAAAKAEEFLDNLRAYRSAAAAFTLANRAQRQRYVKNHTEAESFFTQNNADVPQDQLPVNPELTEDFGTERGATGSVSQRLSSIAPTTAEPVPLASVPYTPSLAKRVGDFLKSGWFWSGAAGKDVAELSDQQKGFESNIAARAAVYFNKLVPAQEKLANAGVASGKYASIKEAREGVRKMIRDRFDAINNIPDKRRRDTMIARFVQQYPELAPLQEAINDVNALTEDYISQRSRDDKAFSEEELTQMKYMIDNKSRYLTRVFTAFQGDAGKTYVSKLYKDIATANAMLAKGKTLPAPLKKVFEDYRAALRFLVRNDVAVSDPAHLAALPLDAVRNLYNLWRPSGSQDAEGVQNQMSTGEGGYDEQKYKDYLSDVIMEVVPKASQKEYDDRAAQILKNILTQTDTGIARRYLRGAKLDESLLEHRQDIPKELRAIYGEVTDVPALVAITMARQSVLAARAKMLADLKADHTGKLIIEGNNEERSKPGNEKFTEELKGESWGPLQGMYTTPTLLKALGDYSDSVVDLDTAVALSVKSPSVILKWASNKIVSGSSALSKAYKLATVGSGIHIAMNAAGSMASFTLAGGVRPEYIMRGMKLALSLIGETAFPEGAFGLSPQNSTDRDAYFRHAIGESAQMQNMRQEPLTILKKIISEAHTTKTDDALGFFENIKVNYGMPAYHTLIEVMAQSDAWAIYPIYLQRAAYLENYARANGDVVNIEKIQQQAAGYAKDIGMSYDRTAPWLRQAEKIPVVGTFMPYLQSTFRSLTYSAINVYADAARAITAKTPEATLIATSMAARQAVGLATVTAGSAIIYQVIADALNDDDEEKAIEAEKEFMDDRFRYGNLISMGKNEEGKNLYFQLSRLDARSSVTDVARILMSDDPPEVKWEAVKKNLKGLWIEPRVGQSTAKLFLDVISDEQLKNKSTRLERMLPLITQTLKNAGTASGVDSSTMESFMEAGDSYMPNAANWFDPKQEKTDKGTAEEVMAGFILAAGGYRMAVADPEKAALYAGLDFDKVKKEGREIIAANLGNIGAQEALGAFVSQSAKERRAIAKAGRIYQAMLDSGMSTAKTNAVFKDLKIFDATDLANIRNKTYEANEEEWAKEYSNLLSSQSLKQRLKDNPEAEQRVEDVKELINKLGYKKLKENR